MPTSVPVPDPAVQQLNQAANNAGAALGGFVMIMFLFMIIMFGVWLWMLINCLTRPGGSFPSGDGGARVVWALLLIFIPFLGQILYLLLVYMPGRRGRYG